MHTRILILILSMTVFLFSEDVNIERTWVLKYRFYDKNKSAIDSLFIESPLIDIPGQDKSIKYLAEYIKSLTDDMVGQTYDEKQFKNLDNTMYQDLNAESFIKIKSTVIDPIIASKASDDYDRVLLCAYAKSFEEMEKDIHITAMTAFLIKNNKITHAKVYILEK